MGKADIWMQSLPLARNSLGSFRSFMKKIKNKVKVEEKEEYNDNEWEWRRHVLSNARHSAWSHFETNLVYVYYYLNFSFIQSVIYPCIVFCVFLFFFFFFAFSKKLGIPFCSLLILRRWSKGFGVATLRNWNGATPVVFHFTSYCVILVQDKGGGGRKRRRRGQVNLVWACQYWTM